jgi:hypothetical protein
VDKREIGDISTNPPVEINRQNIDFVFRRKFYRSLILGLIAAMNLVACGTELKTVVISRPDEYSRTFEAREKVILKAIAKVFMEKRIGSKVTVDQKTNTVESDYVYQNDWRTKSSASVKKLNWKECEVTLTVITEKKSESGWEMRRLLDKSQYDNFFRVIELKLYEEMSHID